MGRRLATDVHVLGPRGPLDFRVIPAGSEVPDRYASQVTAESAYLPEGTGTETTDTADTAAEGYEAQTLEELKELARTRDLAVSGTKGELIARLTDDDLTKA
jgi:hypothetical protein